MGEVSGPTITRYGAMAVVLSDDRRRVLLLRREIFIFWDLPGGGIETGEDPAEAAARECREETGYEVCVERKAGTYRHPSVYGAGDQLTHVYCARVRGGEPKSLGLETTGLRWFDTDRPPRGLQPLQRLMIADALRNSGQPFERSVRFPLWKLYPARVAFGVVRLLNETIRTLFFHKPSH